jgi:hypothetical protein
MLPIGSVAKWPQEIALDHAKSGAGQGYFWQSYQAAAG